jgi:hypothetical protein
MELLRDIAAQAEGFCDESRVLHIGTVGYVDGTRLHPAPLNAFVGPRADSRMTRLALVVSSCGVQVAV